MIPLIVAGFLLQQPETMSLLKEPLYPPKVDGKERTRLETELAEARREAAKAPSTDVALRVAHAQRDLGRIGDALETLTRAAESEADAPAIRLERGRGFILIRKFDLAVRELRKADETMPEAHCDIGFALYLLADYAQAQQEYAKCATPGLFGALASRRSGSAAAAPPPGNPESKDKKKDLTAAYLDGLNKLLAKDVTAARDVLKPLVEKNRDRWMEPVYIAAEAEYARIALPAKRKRQ